MSTGQSLTLCSWLSKYAPNLPFAVKGFKAQLANFMPVLIRNFDIEICSNRNNRNVESGQLHVAHLDNVNLVTVISVEIWNNLPFPFLCKQLLLLFGCFGYWL